MPTNEKLSRNTKTLKLQFFEKIWFFHQKRFFSNGECNLDNGSNYFSLRVHTFGAQIPKTTKKNFELFERKITFLKMFLCTCIKVVVTTLPKFSRQNSEIFLLDFRKWGKINKPSKKFICKIFVWTCTTIFWQACRNHACKSAKDLFRSKSENDSNAKFSKRSIFPSFLSFKN